ncbi:MAG: hypothetical protein JOZ41_04550 [Chloroflexi bacterium]|nr:hypothetical protein [Chloroflexota bacterium]
MSSLSGVLSRVMRSEPPGNPDPFDRRGCRIRVQMGERYGRQGAVSAPWLIGLRDLPAPFRPHAERRLVVEAWEQTVVLPGGKGRGIPAYPDVSLVPWERRWTFDELADLYPNLACRSGRALGDGHGFCNLARCQFPPGHPTAEACRSSELIMSAGVRLALLTLAYLLQCEEHVVAVRPVERKGEKVRPAGKDPKPWTRSLPHLILLDPLRAREYGQPGGAGERDETPGGHTSPRPHGRRGHWRMLRAERFRRDEAGQVRRVFVRPAWIGPREWLSEGQRYQVIEIANADAARATRY